MGVERDVVAEDAQPMTRLVRDLASSGRGEGRAEGDGALRRSLSSAGSREGRRKPRGRQGAGVGVGSGAGDREWYFWGWCRGVEERRGCRTARGRGGRSGCLSRLG